MWPEIEGLFAYLRYLSEKLLNIDVKDPNTIDELLPYSTSLPRNRY